MTIFVQEIMKGVIKQNIPSVQWLWFHFVAADSFPEKKVTKFPARELARIITLLHHFPAVGLFFIPTTATL